MRLILSIKVLAARVQFSRDIYSEERNPGLQFRFAIPASNRCRDVKYHLEYYLRTLQTISPGIFKDATPPTVFPGISVSATIPESGSAVDTGIAISEYGGWKHREKRRVLTCIRECIQGIHTLPRPGAVSWLQVSWKVSGDRCNSKTSRKVSI